MTTHVVTGGAGFIAVSLIRDLLARGHQVVAVDNFCRGLRSHWSEFQASNHFSGVQADCSDVEAFLAAFPARQDIHTIWHFAANSDIPAGIADPGIDLRDTFLTTFHALGVARAVGAKVFNFASSSAIYGDLKDTLIHEDIGPLEPISNYGAMKLASEAQIRAVVEATDLRANIFRFPNVIGVPATHGVMLDFVRKLENTPDRLDVLGNGSQRKAYLHVEELVEAMLFINDYSNANYNVFNIGPKDIGISVSRIAEIIRDLVSPSAEIAYGTEERGWIGDVPKFRYSTERLSEFGWTAKLSSEDAIRRAAIQIAAQERQT